MAHLRIAAAAEQACQGFRQPSRPHALLQALALLAPLLLLAGLVHRQRCAADGAGVVLQHASGHNFQECCSGQVHVREKDNAVQGLWHATWCSRWARGQLSGHVTGATKGSTAADHKMSGQTVPVKLGAALVNTYRVLRPGQNMQGRCMVVAQPPCGAMQGMWASSVLGKPRLVQEKPSHLGN